MGAAVHSSGRRPGKDRNRGLQPQRRPSGGRLPVACPRPALCEQPVCDLRPTPARGCWSRRRGRQDAGPVAERGHLEDMPRSLLAQGGQDRLGHLDGAVEVGVVLCAASDGAGFLHLDPPGACRLQRTTTALRPDQDRRRDSRQSRRLLPPNLRFGSWGRLRIPSPTPSSGQRSDSGRATKRASSSAAPRGRSATAASGNVVITARSRAPGSGSRAQAEAGALTAASSRSPS